GGGEGRRRRPDRRRQPGEGNPPRRAGARRRSAGALVIRELRTLGRHALIYGSGFLLARAAGFLLVPLYTRFLTPADYGVIELLDLTAFFVGTFVALGMEQAVMKFYHAYDEPADRHRVISSAILFTACSGLVMIAITVPLRGVFSELVLGSRNYEGIFFIAFV